MNDKWGELRSAVHRLHEGPDWYGYVIWLLLGWGQGQGDALMYASQRIDRDELDWWLGCMEAIKGLTAFARDFVTCMAWIYQALGDERFAADAGNVRWCTGSVEVLFFVSYKGGNTYLQRKQMRPLLRGDVYSRYWESYDVKGGRPYGTGGHDNSAQGVVWRCRNAR